MSVLTTSGSHRQGKINFALRASSKLRPAWAWGNGASRRDIAESHLPCDVRSVNWRRLLGPGKWLLLAFLMAALVICEMRTSALQSQVFAHWAKKMTYAVGPGPSDTVVFPRGGPWDERHGYSRIPEFSRLLEGQGFRVREQARFTRELQLAAGLGLTPPYRAPADAGLIIRSDQDTALYRAFPGDTLFASYEEIPAPIVDALLFIEDRGLARRPADCRANPVVDWNRLAKASWTYLGTKLGLPVRLQGGSTLATQIEKYRHWPGGRTASASDKLRQMVSASLKVYDDGVDACAARRRIVCDYLNTVPLGAVPGYGEVHGLGKGLYAWFGADLREVSDLLRDPSDPQDPDRREAKARAYKQVLALLYAARAPSYYLAGNRGELEYKVGGYVRLMAGAGLIGSDFARAVETVKLTLNPHPAQPRIPTPRDKASAAIRNHLLRTLRIPGLYELDRLHLEARSTIDEELQDAAARVIAELRSEEFLRSHGMLEDRLLAHGRPADVNYSVLLFESRPEGNLLRVQSDSLADPFDANEGVKMQLGSTAKLRTLAHYLEIMAALHEEMSRPGGPSPSERARSARDPLTRWAAQTLAAEPGLELLAFLRKALERSYSASPHEVFFTGGGQHTFSNFDAADNGRVLSVREGLVRSVNLVFIRLMRDLVLFHRSRLPYDPDAVLSLPDHPERQRLLEKSAEEESRRVLWDAYNAYRGLSPQAAMARLLGSGVRHNRKLAIVGLAWDRGSTGAAEEVLARWFAGLGVAVAPEEIRRLARAYGDPRLDLADYAFLLDVHPLELWCAGMLRLDPGISWTELWQRSAEARKTASAWLFRSRNRRAQDLRLRARMEEDAFERMTPYWKRLGFPFERLVPSLATAIGSSSDRPAALAELMGIIVNGGVRRPTVRIRDLRLGPGTPYHTVLEALPAQGERVMHPEVARALREVLAEVVRKGTARRLSGAFGVPHGNAPVVGGKTGSGDNRFVVFGPGGTKLAARPVDRTATFVFYIGDRYFGVVTAYVEGRAAEDHRFTSALPVTVLKLLAPDIMRRLAADPPTAQLGAAAPTGNEEGPKGV